jgi:subtilase family serine protease
LGLFRGRRRQGPANRSAVHAARRRALDFRRTGLEQLEQRTLLSVSLQYDHIIASNGVGNNIASATAPAKYPSPPASAFNPTQIEQAYGIDQVKLNGVQQDGTGMTIAIIDAYDNPQFVSRNGNARVTADPAFLASDLHQFDLRYNLPEPAGFFTKVDQTGGTNYPAGNTGWGTEIALDVE